MTQSNNLKFHKYAVAIALLFFSMTYHGHAQIVTPPSIPLAPPPPAANGTQNGDHGGTNMQPPPNRNGGQADEDYDSSSEPFGRGCPFRDNDLQLVS